MAVRIFRRDAWSEVPQALKRKTKVLLTQIETRTTYVLVKFDAVTQRMTLRNRHGMEFESKFRDDTAARYRLEFLRKK